MRIRTCLMTGLFLLAAGCSNASQLFQIMEFYPMTGCADPTYAEGTFSYAGELDVAAGSPTFMVAAHIGSTGTGGGQLVSLKSGETLDVAGRNPPVVTEYVVTYRLSKKIGTAPKPYVVPATMPFRKDGTIDKGIQLISPELGDLLFNGLSPSATPNDDFVDVLCDVEFKGVFTSSQTPFTTGVLSFPIHAYRSAPTKVCPAPKQFTRYPFMDKNGDPDLCRYVGQSFDGQFAAVPDATSSALACCTAGALGC